MTSIAALADAAGISRSTMAYRLRKRGMSPEEAASTPLRHVDLDIIGAKRGRLTIERYAGKNARGIHLWDCSCSCGTPSVIVTDTHSKTGNTTSCGCLRREAQQKLAAAAAERFATYVVKGKRYSLSGLSRAFNISRRTLRDRIDGLGWTVEAAVTIPPDVRFSRRIAAKVPAEPSEAETPIPAPSPPSPIEPFVPPTFVFPKRSAPPVHAPLVSPVRPKAKGKAALTLPVRLAVVPDDAITRRADHFKCRSLNATITAGTCIDRQAVAHGTATTTRGSEANAARILANRFAWCSSCPQGTAVEAAVRRAAPAGMARDA